MRTAFEQIIALSLVPPSSSGNFPISGGGMGLDFLCSRGVESLTPLTSSDCRAHASRFESLEQGRQVQPVAFTAAASRRDRRVALVWPRGTKCDIW